MLHINLCVVESLYSRHHALGPPLCVLNLTKIVHKCLHYHVNLFHLRYWWDWKIWASLLLILINVFLGFNTNWCNLGVVCTGLYRKVFKDHTYSLYFREYKEGGFTVVYLLWNVIQINLPTRLPYTRVNKHNLLLSAYCILSACFFPGFAPG